MSIEELKNNPSFSLLLVLAHDEIVPFVADQFRGKTLTIRGYLVTIFLMVAIIIAVAAFDAGRGLISFFDLLKYFGAGVVLVFSVLVIVHEGLHGLAYKMVGAPRVSFGANWRMFYFYAVADRFVANRKSFIFVALLPFLVISILVIVVLPFAPVHWKWLFIGVLFIHTAACAGDFAMLAFYEQYQQAGELLTYDDVSEKRSYFYLRE